MNVDSRKGFAEVYQQYAPAIYRFLYWQTKDQVLAQDLTSAVFEKAWRARSSFKGGSIQAWLYRIARNLLIDHWRKKKELFMDDIAGLAEQLEGPSQTYDYDKEQLAWQLGKALDGLNQDERSVVVLRFIENLAAKEVAEILNLTEVNVRVMQFRALRKMRKYMPDDISID